MYLLSHGCDYSNPDSLDVGVYLFRTSSLNKEIKNKIKIFFTNDYRYRKSSHHTMAYFIHSSPFPPPFPCFYRFPVTTKVFTPYLWISNTLHVRESLWGLNFGGCTQVPSGVIKELLQNKFSVLPGRNYGEYNFLCLSCVIHVELFKK